MASRLTIPLTALRPEVEQGWPRDLGVRWLPNGIDALADLEQPADSEIAFRVRGFRGARLRATVSLLDPQSGWGASRVSVQVRRLVGGSRVVWKGTLAMAGGRAIPTARLVEAGFDEDGEVELVLRATARVTWVAPRIELADAASEPTRETSAPDRSPRKQTDGPLISILMPVHDPPPTILQEAIDSVGAQTFTDWELCLADDGSTDEEVRRILAQGEKSDERVRLVRREVAGGISAATNSALEIARGDFIALLDHDDTLVPDALERVAALLAEQPQIDWVYSHEDVVDDGNRVHAYLKPGWSPELLLSQMYTCHFGVYRRSLADEIGGFRSEFDGSQDYDFALRFAERTNRVAAIPRVLYHWRAHAGSVAGNPHSKPGAHPAARRAIQAHLERTGVKADVEFGFLPGLYRVIHRFEQTPRIGVALAAGNAAGLEDLLDSLGDAAVAGVEPERIAVERGQNIDSSAQLRQAAEQCRDLDVIVLIDGPVVPLTRHWLLRLAGFALQDGVGAVGGKLIAASGLIESVGEAIHDGIPLPLMSGSPASHGGPMSMALQTSNVSAVAGVLATSGEAFRKLSGLDPEMGGLVLSDYCLRAREMGVRTVLAADTILRRPRGVTPVNDLFALPRFIARWRQSGDDPYFALSRGWPGAELAV